MVDASGCSVTLNGTELSGTFEVVSGDTVPNIGDKYRLKFTSKDGTYTAESEEFSAEIQPKRADNYGGKCRESVRWRTSGEKMAYTAGGLVTGDEITEVIGIRHADRMLEKCQKMCHSGAKISGNGTDKTGNYAISLRQMVR